MDENGLKQGLWRFYRDLYFKDNIDKPFRHHKDSSECIMTGGNEKYVIQSFLICKGYFENNRKVGDWELLFTDRSNYYFEEGTYGPPDIATYFNDGSFLVKKTSGYPYIEMNYTKDSIPIRGKYEIQINEKWITIFLDCQKSIDHNCTMCMFKLTNGVVVAEFCSSEIEIFEHQLRNGEIYRKIKNFP